MGKEKKLIDEIVGDSVYAFDVGFKTNFFIVKGENNKYILFDIGVEGEEQKVISALKDKYNATLNDISLIIISHAHFDHCGTIHYIKKNYPNIPIAVPEKELDFFRNGISAPAIPLNLLGTLIKKFRGDKFEMPSFEPDILFKGGERLDEYGIKGKIIFTPGHTVGGISLLLDNGVLIANDVMGGSAVLYGKPNFHLFYEDKMLAIRTMKKVLEEENVQVILITHGNHFTREPALKWLRKQLKE
ncbi:hypothetical protein ABK040_009041 [Willaertia magna]